MTTVAAPEVSSAPGAAPAPQDSAPIAPLTPLADEAEISAHLLGVIDAAAESPGEIDAGDSTTSSTAAPEAPILEVDAALPLVTLVDDGTGGLTVETTEVRTAADVAAVAADVAAAGSLVAAGVDDLVQLSEPVPVVGLSSNDSFRASQWALDRVPFEAAWPVANGASVIVAVIDTAVDLSHPDLAGRLTGAYHFRSTGSGPGFETSPPGNFHGTHVSGIIAAVADNLAGVTGAAPGVQVMPIEVLGTNGSGRYSDITSAIIHATDQGAAVINLSLGGSASFAPLDAAIAYAEQHRVVVMAAAGNDYCEVGVNAGCATVYPAASPYTVAIGSLDADLDCSAFTTRAPYVELGAPGGGIISTAPFSTHVSGYATASGTSMATPYASAAAAIVRSARPGLTAAEVRDTLISTAVDVVTAGADTCTGAGLIDPVAALDQLGTIVPGSPGTTVPSGPLAAPRLAGALAGRGMVRLSVVAPPGAELISIYRDGQLIASIDPVRRSFTDRAVAARTSYDYEVVAWASWNGDSATSVSRSVTTRG